MTVYFQRELTPTVLAALRNMPVVVVTGLRQIGKTTFLQNQFPGDTRRLVAFDDFAQLSAAKSHPDGFVHTDDTLTINEAHKCLEAFLAATPNCKAAALCYNGREAVQLGKKIWALPLGLLLS